MPTRGGKRRSVRPQGNAPHRSRRTSDGDKVFAHLVAPVTVTAFLDHYYEKRELLVARSDAEYFRDLLTVDDVDSVITQFHLTPPALRLVNARSDVPLAVSDYVDRRNVVDPRRVFELFAGGATIILPQLHRYVPKLGRFIAALETVFTQPFQANVYLTPPDAQGFKLHYDTHDVFIVQVTGSKDWSLFEPPVRLPLRGQPFDSTKHKVGAATRRFTLGGGDVLYIPRGVPHEARSTNQTSLHITVGILSYTWTDLLIDAVAQLCLDDPAFRAALPPGFAHSDFDTNRGSVTAARLAARLAHGIDVRRSLEGFADDFVGTRRTMLRSQLMAASDAPKIAPDTRLRRRPFLVHRLKRGKSTATITLKAFGVELSLPARARAALKAALEAADFSPRELPGPLDEKGRLALARRLIEAGIVEVATR